VIGVAPPHVTDDAERGKAIPLEELSIDLGCATASEVETLGIRVGSPAIVDSPFVELSNGCISAKALDDRAGCAVLIGLLIALKGVDLDVDLIACFSTQEETGGTGAVTSANALQPDAALVLEGTTGTDTPGIPPHKFACALRKGPAITVADRYTIVPEKMLDYIETEARAGKIPYQIKTPRIGATNGHLIQPSGKGVLTGIVSVPCRYIHSPVGVLCKEDLQNTLALMVRLVEKAGRGLL
jgi:endoglucanase